MSFKFSIGPSHSISEIFWNSNLSYLQTEKTKNEGDENLRVSNQESKGTM